MAQIKIHTEAPSDPYTQVVVITDTGIAIRQHGEVGTGPYILASDLKKLLTPRTDADRVAFIERGRYDIDSRSDGTWSIYDRVAKNFPFGYQDFDSWTSAVDSLIDMEEQL